MESLILPIVLIVSTTNGLLIIGDGEVAEYDFAVASYYSDYHYNRLTANGEVFNDSCLTFAHKTMKFGTLVEFYYKGKSVVARCNDRGPFIEGRDFDLSYQVAKRLGFLKVGVDRIVYKIIKEDTEKFIKVRIIKKDISN